MVKVKVALLALWKWNRKNGTKLQLCRARLSSQAGALFNSKPSNRGSFVCLPSRSLSCCEGCSGQCFLCAIGERTIHWLQAGACPEECLQACLCQRSYFTVSQGNRGGPACCWPLPTAPPYKEKPAEVLDPELWGPSNLRGATGSCPFMAAPGKRAKRGRETWLLSSEESGRLKDTWHAWGAWVQSRASNS